MSRKDPRRATVNRQGRDLSAIAEVILETDATPEAIAAQLESLGLGNAERQELVDYLNHRAESMALRDLPAALRELSERTCLIARQLNYEKGIAASQMFTGVSLWFTSDLEASLRNLIEARRRFATLGDEAGQVRALMFEGCVNRSLGDYDQSYLDLMKCIEYFRDCEDRLWEALAAMSLAITCEQVGDYKGMKQHNGRVVEIVTAPDQQWIVARALNGLGNTYFREGDYQNALEYYEKSLTASRECVHRVSEARSLNDIGVVWQRLGDAEKAERCYRESLEIRVDIGQREAQCTCLFNLGELAMGIGDYQRALDYFGEALVIATEVGAKPRISQAHRHLSAAYELTGDTTGALRHHKVFHEVNEEVAREQSSTRMKNLTTRMELDKAEQLAEIEQQKNAKLSEKNEELRRLLDELQKAQAQLVQSEKMAVLGKLVAGVAHELNSPVGASASSNDISRRCVAGLVSLMETAESLEELRAGGRMQKLLDSLVTNNDVVSKANERISRIVKSLKSFARLDEAPFQTVDIHDGLEATITLLESERDAGVRFERQYKPTPAIPCYPGELNQAFLNLLTNSVEAIQRTSRNGTVLVRTGHDDKHVLVEIQDDGVGVPEDKLNSLFDPAFTAARGRVKAGMGLFVSHGIIQKHQGSMALKSKVNEGTTVTVSLPIQPARSPVKD